MAPTFPVNAEQVEEDGWAFVGEDASLTQPLPYVTTDFYSDSTSESQVAGTAMSYDPAQHDKHVFSPSQPAVKEYTRAATVIIEAGNVLVEQVAGQSRYPVYPQNQTPSLLMVGVECSLEELQQAQITRDDPSDVQLVFITCGPDVKVPLTKQVVVLRMAPALYTFVLPQAAFYSFTFSKETPTILLEQFECFIERYSHLRIKTTPVADKTTYQIIRDTMTKGLEGTGAVIAAGLVGGAIVVGESLKGASRLVQANTNLGRQDRKVFPPFRWMIKGTRFASRSTVRVSSALVNSVVYAASEITTGVTKHTVCPIADRMGGSGGSSGELVSTAVAVGKSSFRAVGSVFDALDEGVDIIVEDTSNAVSDTVRHKLGKEHGDLSVEYMGIASDLTRTYSNVKGMGVKPITKSVAKTAVKSSVKTVVDHKEEKKKLYGSDNDSEDKKAV